MAKSCAGYQLGNPPGDHVAQARVGEHAARLGGQCLPGKILDGVRQAAVGLDPPLAGIDGGLARKPGRVREQLADLRSPRCLSLAADLDTGEIGQVLVDRIIPRQLPLLHQQGHERGGMRLGDGGDPARRIDSEGPPALEVRRAKRLAEDRLASMQNQQAAAGNEPCARFLPETPPGSARARHRSKPCRNQACSAATSTVIGDVFGSAARASCGLPSSPNARNNESQRCLLLSMRSSKRGFAESIHRRESGYESAGRRAADWCSLRWAFVLRSLGIPGGRSLAPFLEDDESCPANNARGFQREMRVVDETHLIPGEMLSQNMNHERQADPQDGQHDRCCDPTSRGHHCTGNDESCLPRHVVEKQGKGIRDAGVAEAARSAEADDLRSSTTMNCAGDIAQHGRRQDTEPSQPFDEPSVTSPLGESSHCPIIQEESAGAFEQCA